jgi:hypothetical protein
MVKVLDNLKRKFNIDKESKDGLLVGWSLFCFVDWVGDFKFFIIHSLLN